MISVEEIYQIIRDFARKSHTSWTGNDEFNRKLVLAQDMLFDYYRQMKDDKQRQRALISFRREKRLVRDTGSVYTIPVDFEDDIEIWAAPNGNDECNDEDMIYQPVDVLRDGSIGFIVTSPIRKPSLDNVKAHYASQTDLRIYPLSFRGWIKMLYYATPVSPSRAVTLDTVNQQEIYDPVNTVDLEWDTSVKQDFIDVLLLFYGIEQRDTALVSWVAQKQQIEPLVTKTVD
jgi:hypothetical protein